MPALLVRLATWLMGSVGLKFLATKALLLTLFTTVLALVLYNFGCEWLEEALTWGLAEVGGVSVPGQPTGIVTSLTGLSGYLAAHLQIPACLSFIVSVCVARFAIKLVAGFIPGLGGLK